MSKADLLLLSAANQLLAEFISILTVSRLADLWKIGLLPTLLYRCFRICSYWTNFCLELVKLIDVFTSNGYPENFTNNYCKVFLDNKYAIQEKGITVLKKTLVLVLPYLEPISLQTRAKLRQPLKGILNYCKLQNKLEKAFCFKDRFPKEITSVVIYKFQCGLCN